jgi:two-component system, NarL family, sensor histidine kinase EvgS
VRSDAGHGFGTVLSRRIIRSVLRAVAGAIAAGMLATAGVGATPSGHQMSSPPPAEETPLPPLRVVAVNTFRPISFADEDGEPAGIIEDYFDLVRQSIGLAVRDVRVMSAMDAEEALRNGDADVLIGIVRSEERTKNGIFSVPVYSTPAVIVTRHGAPAADSFASLRGKTLALREHHFAMDLLHQRWPTIKLLEAGTESRAVLQAVVDRRADAALLSLDATRVWLADPKFSMLVVSGFPPDMPYQFAFQIRPALAAQLAPQLDQAIAQLTVEQRSDVMERWLADTVRVKSSQHGIPLATALFGVVGIAAIVILIFFLAGMRRELRRQRDEAERFRAERERALAEAEANSHLTSFLAHETRNIVNALEGSLALLALNPQRAAQARVPDAVGSSAKALSALIDVTLDGARLDAGRLEPHLTSTDLQALIEQVVREFEPLAWQKQLMLSAVPPERECRIVTDGVRVGQIIRNLVANAVKYTHEGRVWLEVHRDAEGKAVLTVTDTGGGIAAGTIERLMKPVERTGVLDALKQGSGIGLSISRDLARLLGGELTVRNFEHEGARFTLVLHDYKQVEHPAAAGARIAAALGIAAAPSRKKPDEPMTAPTLP